jgi:hypothetical protein
MIIPIALIVFLAFIILGILIDIQRKEQGVSTVHACASGTKGAKHW